MLYLGGVLGLCLSLTACINFPAPIAAELAAARPDEANPFAQRVPSGARTDRADDADHEPANQHTARRGPALNDLPLVSGQIVVYETHHDWGLFVSLFAADYLPWTHVGILSLEAEGPVVYDITGTFYPVPGLPPTRFTSGRVRRMPFADYASTGKITGIYSLPPGADAGKAIAFAREHYARGTPYDGVYDSSDDSALYCGELVARALEAAGAAPIRQSAMRENRSYALIREWLGIRTPGLFLPGHVTDPARQVAVWSDELSPAQIEAYFEIRRELSRRFDAQTRIGHLFAWTGSELVMRDSPYYFGKDTLADFASYEGDTEGIRREVRRRADLYFSVTPPGTTASASGSDR